MESTIYFDDKTEAIELHEAIDTLHAILNGMENSIEIERNNINNPIANAEYAKLNILVNSAIEIASSMRDSIVSIDRIY